MVILKIGDGCNFPHQRVQWKVVLILTCSDCYTSLYLSTSHTKLLTATKGQLLVEILTQFLCHIFMERLFQELESGQAEGFIQC